VFFNNGDATFNSAVPYSTWGGSDYVAAVDLDGDKDIDLAVAVASEVGDLGHVSILLNRGDGSFETAVPYDAGHDPETVFPADFDGDGDNDLVVASRLIHSVSVLYNNGDGTFGAPVHYPVQRYPKHAAAADFDGDSDYDIVANGSEGAASILINNGDGKFEAAVSYPVSPSGGTLFCADLDDDQDTDLIFKSNGLAVLLNNGDGSFGRQVVYDDGESIHATLVFCADFDGDEDVDLVVPNNASDDVSFFRNKGDGSFAVGRHHAVGRYPYAVIAADFDEDNDLDLATADHGANSSPDGAGVSVLINDGGGGFTDAVTYCVGLRASDVCAAYLDEDRHLDLAVAIPVYGWAAVLLGNGDGTFSDPIRYTTGSSSFIVSGDFDRDMDIDLAVCSYGLGTVSVLLNQGDGAFGVAVPYFVGRSPTAMVCADFDHDHDDDLALAFWMSSGLTGGGMKDIAAGDFDGDGDIDLAAACGNKIPVMFIMSNNGDGTFAAPIPYGEGQRYQAVTVADVDFDQDLDLITGVSWPYRISVLLNEGDGSFPTYDPHFHYHASGYTYSLVCANLNRDPEMDLAVADYGGGVVILDGRTVPGSCEGLRGNVDGDDMQSINISDLLYLADYMFHNGLRPASLEEADVDGNSVIDIADLVYLIDYIFNSGPPPVACP
jgi:hypothetical protein